MKELLSPLAIEALLLWYKENRRDLPWRHTRDPYRIWISEIMLQQTRVEAVKPYYARFLEVCPDISSLALLPEEQLLKLWEGLGYYSRARNLQKAAKTVLSEYGGEMPHTYAQLRKLSGIGDYTAGAIASIAFGERVPAIDGNVLRVLTRLGGRYDDITKPETKQKLRDALVPIVPADAGDFTQALIELGATVCIPNGEAKCENCPLKHDCIAARDGLCDEIPVRTPKKPRRIEPLTVLLLRDGARTVLHKRPDRGLLAGLFELPNTQGHLSEEQMPAYIRSIGFEPVRITRLEDAKHIFTHIEWHMIAYDVRISPDFDGRPEHSELFLISNEELHRDYAIPSAFAAYKKFL